MTHDFALVRLTGAPLTPADVESVARGGRAVVLGAAGAERLGAARAALEQLAASGRALYGINTGFGSLSKQRIPDDQLSALQHNLIRSHAAGVGEPLAPDVVRAMMLLLAASLARGASGVRAALVAQVVALLNRGITPVVPSVGSVGASGDLAPLAHVALALIGEGEVTVGGARIPAARALAEAEVAPLALEMKEGLALINGTHLMAAQGALLVRDVERLIDAALVAAAMSIDACRATDAFLDERVYALRAQPGPAEIAARLRALMRGSGIVPSHVEGDTRVQDPYSLRCAAMVLGAAWDAFGYVRGGVTAELGAVTDNPLLVGLDGTPDIVSAGNFHGMPLAIPLDTLAIALCHVAGIAERRVYLMLSAHEPEMHVRPYLSPVPGLHSGLMIAQYTAAACVNELVGLSHPASVANIPTSAGMEDYNSFGPRAAAKARRAVELATQVIAIELLCAAEALEYHRPLRSGDAVERAHARIRAAVPRLTEDRPLSPDIAAIAALVEDGTIAAAAR